MIKHILCSVTLFLASASVYAMPPFTGTDYSGEYVCKGSNDNVGDYEVIVNLQLNTFTSHDIYGVYDFVSVSNNQPTYVGQVLAKGAQFAISFRLLSNDSLHFSTGMGAFKKTGFKRWRFNTTYYEPDGNGGNFGRDSCTLKPAAPLLGLSSEKHHKTNPANS